MVKKSASFLYRLTNSQVSNAFNFIAQVKTSQYRKPWDENPEDQKIERKVFSKAVDQLQRDILRFTELLPELNLEEKIHFKFFAAFPYAENKGETKESSGCGVLSREDFESVEKLNEKLKLQRTKRINKNKKELAISILGRYLGLHSVIPLKNKKEAFNEETKFSRNYSAKVEAAICLLPTDKKREEIKNDEDESIIQNLRSKMSGVENVKKIFEAIEKPRYQNKIIDQYIDMPVDHEKKFDIAKTDADCIYPWKRKTSSNPIILGREQMKLVIDYHDTKLDHQGSDKILDRLRDKKIEIFDLLTKENQDKTTFEKIECSEMLKRYYDCIECEMKDTLRKKGETRNGKVFLSDSDAVSEALKYADYHHQGNHKAFNRLKSWCDFENMDDKVNPHFFYFCDAKASVYINV